ncbi:MAG: chemotaxis protein CheB [Pyrinomonadaceae bacterium]
MPGRDIIVVGASAGGVEALRSLVAGLPEEFSGSLFVVMHTAPDSPGVLASILDRAGPLVARHAANRERIQPGHIYVAPPDMHLLLEPGLMRLSRGPRENRFRPAIDPLFRSAAQVYGPRVVGVILTGGLDDGTSGLWTVKRLGGVAVVQNPDEAFMSSMPLNALAQVEVDYTLRLAEIPPLLVRLTSLTLAAQGGYEVPEELDIEVNIAKADGAFQEGVTKLGTPSVFTCPECHGTLLQLKENGRTRYRCHTGHAYSTDSLLADLSEDIEATLWSAIRSIAESVMLMRHMAEHLRDSDSVAAERFLEKTREAERRGELVRKAVFDHENLSEKKVADTSDPASANA